MIESGNANQEAMSRKILYQFLTFAFYEPEAGIIADLKKDDNVNMLRDAAELFLGLEDRELITEIMNAAPIIDENDMSAFRDLKAEYTRLFIGPATPACPPYESVFDKNRPVEWQGTMAGPTADAMADALAREGLNITLEYAELADHIAIELEYMYYLLAKAYSENPDAESSLEKANKFLENNLSEWLPSFASLLGKKTDHPFYQKIASLLMKVIDADLKTIKN